MTEDGFWDRIDKTGRCWPWTAARDGHGYGALRFNGRFDRAHRVAWALVAGRPVPEGMYVCHRCDNPPCCRPEHLFLGTPRENSRDCSEKGRRTRTGHIRMHRPGAWRIYAWAPPDPITGQPRQVTKVVYGRREDAEFMLKELLRATRW